MGHKFTSIRTNSRFMVTVAITEKGDVYARPGIPACQPGEKRMQWNHHGCEVECGWEFMGNVLKEAQAPPGSTGVFQRARRIRRHELTSGD